MGSQEVWFVAGKNDDGEREPGAMHFGELIRSLRQQRDRTAKALAADPDVALSPGFLFAIERGDRAPSAETGRRLLEKLLPDGASLDEDSAADLAFTHPDDPSRRILVEFKASKRGDNSKWSLDRLEDRAKRDAGPEWVTYFLRSLKGRIEPVPPGMSGMYLPEPGTGLGVDQLFGKVVRRLAAADRDRLLQVDRFIDGLDREAREEHADAREPADERG